MPTPYSNERASGLRPNGRIHIRVAGTMGTVCGLGDKQFQSLSQAKNPFKAHMLAEENDHATCQSCMNVANDHDEGCGWCYDWHSCTCQINSASLKFPLTIEWNLFDNIPAGSIVEGMDEYQNWKELVSHARDNVEHFSAKGHKGVYVRYNVRDDSTQPSNWLRLSLQNED